MVLQQDVLWLYVPVDYSQLVESFVSSGQVVHENAENSLSLVNDNPNKSSRQVCTVESPIFGVFAHVLIEIDITQLHYEARVDGIGHITNVDETDEKRRIERFDDGDFVALDVFPPYPLESDLNNSLSLAY